MTASGEGERPPGEEPGPPDGGDDSTGEWSFGGDRDGASEADGGEDHEPGGEDHEPGRVAPGGRGSEIRDVLYGGETLEEEVAVGAGRVAVTSHRVLALVPRDEPRFRAVHRPNVEGVDVRSGGRARDGARAIRAGVYAAVLLGAGALIDLGGLIRPVEAPSGVGIGGVLGLVNVLVGVLGLVDDALLGLGVVALGVALFSLGRYLRSRERYLEVAVSGDEPLRVPIAGGETAAADRLGVALRRSGDRG